MCKKSGSKSIAILMIVIMLAGLLSASPSSAARAQPARVVSPQEQLAARCLNAADVRTAKASNGDALRFVGTQPGKAVPQPKAVAKGTAPEAAARAYLDECGGLYGIHDTTAELATQSSKVLADGRSVVRFQQLYQGVPVLAGEMVVQLDQQNNLLALVNKAASVKLASVSPAVEPEAARQSALQSVAKNYKLDESSLTATEPKLWVYDPMLLNPGDTTPARLVWRMDVTASTSPVDELVLIEAQRGGIALEFNQVDTSQGGGVSKAPAAAKLAGNLPASLAPILGAPVIYVYTLNHATSGFPGTLVCTSANPTPCSYDLDAYYAYAYAYQTYQFYANSFGRDGINGLGMPIISTVHYGYGYANAGWNGYQMIYGDGYAQGEDVVGHELTHGVTQYESNLFYFYQSGAINESLSDVFGEFIEKTYQGDADWQLGENLPGGAIRNMADPTIFGDPDKMSSVYYYTGSSDNGGVHWDSGINNKAAYLMTDGNTFNSITVSPLGKTKVARIYYEAQTNLLTSGADYFDLYNALYQACLNLYLNGTGGITLSDCQQVQNATNAVEMNAQPVSGFNPDAPVCAAGQVPVDVFNDGFEAGTGQWMAATPVGTPRWSLDSIWGAFAHGGLNFLFADDYPAATTGSYVAMVNSVNVPSAAFLHFYHAYGFENGWDGGVLEYTTNNGATWTDAGALFNSNGYTGSIISGSSNPLQGRSAFIGDSHGYVSSRVNLSSLAGQNVRFRWYMGLDSSGSYWGWWLDDVEIYTCQTTNLGVNIFNVPMGSYYLPPSGSTRVSYAGINSGPVRIGSTTGATLIPSERVLYKVNNVNTSFTEMMGLPNSQLDTTYWLPWYNDVDLDTQLRFGNVSGSTASVHVYIHQAEMAGSPFNLSPGASTRVSFAGISDGPVQITSNQQIVASERVLYKVNNVNTSFSEMMALPTNRVDTNYWLPWYNDVDLDTQLRIANIGSSSTQVHILIGGVEMAGSPLTLGNGASTRISFPGVSSGPVQITGGQQLVASERVIYKVNGVNTSFSETMAQPNTTLDSTYLLPWYNDVDLDTQLRIGNVSGLSNQVHVYIGGVERAGSPFTLGVNGSTRISFPGVSSGPVRVTADHSIVLAERVLYNVNGIPTSFSEMMALPNSRLDTSYWLPWYNDVDLDTQLRFGLP